MVDQEVNLPEPEERHPRRYFAKKEKPEERHFCRSTYNPVISLR
ncbi:MAG TPA: hypothetical protein PKU76_04620 [Candidatus Cloacimonas sp.]|nr:hypothetical protein [Candidatus Cloacimonas sp.]